MAVRPPAPPSRIDVYEILSELGRGGMGIVYEVRHLETRVRYALKLVLPSAGLGPNALARFEREAQSVARLDHPGVVRVHHVGNHRGSPYVVMDLVSGQSIHDRIRTGDPLPPEEIARTVAATADVIEHVHSRRVVHRDLKPENVMLDDDGQVRVLDFGIAAVDERIRLTQEGSPIGSPMFMAPEQLAGGSRDYGPATDVYGLGSILYALLAHGGEPFARSSLTELMLAKVRDDPVPPSDHAPGIPAELEDICLVAMERSEDERYASAAELAGDLRRWLRGEPVSASSSSGVGRLLRRIIPARGPRRRAAAVVVSALVATVLALGVALVVWQNSVARRKRVELHRGLLADIDRQYARAIDGDLDALQHARRLLDEARRAGIDDEKISASRRAVVDGLGALADPERAERLARTLAFHEDPWRPHHESVIRVLLAARQLRALAIAVAREPALLRGTAVDEIAEALVAGSVELDDDLAGAVALALLGRLEDGPRDDATAIAARRSTELLAARVQLRRLEQRLTRTPPSVTEVAPIVQALIPTLRSFGRPRELALDGPTLGALTDLARAARDETATPSERTAGVVLLEGALRLLPADDERAARLAFDLQQDAMLALTGGDAEMRARSLEIALLLRRVDAWPFPLRDLSSLAPDDDALARRIRAELGRGGSELVPSDTVSLLAVLYDRTRKSYTDREVRNVVATWATLLDLRESVAALLEREAAEHDLPGWALGWIAERLRGIADWDGGRPIALDADDELVGALLPRAAAAIGRPGERIELADAVEGIFEAALARDADRPAAAREPKVALAYAEWLVDAADRATATSTFAVIEEGLRRAAARRPSDGGPLHARDAERARSIVAVAHEAADRLLADAPGAKDEQTDATLTRLAEAARGALPGSPFAASLAAMSLARGGRPEEALARLDVIDPSAEGSGPALLRRAELLLELGRTDEARAAAERTAPARIDDPRSLERRARLWESLGRPERAREDRRRIELGARERRAVRERVPADRERVRAWRRRP